MRARAWCQTMAGACGARAAHRIGAIASMSSSFCRSRASRRRSTESCCAVMRWPDGAGATMLPEALAGGTQSWVHSLTVSQRRCSVMMPLGTPRTCPTGILGYGCVSAGSRNRCAGCATQFESRGSGAREQCVCNEGKTARHANNTPYICQQTTFPELSFGLRCKEGLSVAIACLVWWQGPFGIRGTVEQELGSVCCSRSTLRARCSDDLEMSRQPALSQFLTVT